MFCFTRRFIRLLSVYLLCTWCDRSTRLLFLLCHLATTNDFLNLHNKSTHTRLWKCGFETGALDGVFFMKCLLWKAFLNGVFQHVHRPPSEATVLCSFNPSQVAFDIETVDLLDRSDGITPKNFSRMKLFLVFSWYFPCIFNIGMSGVFLAYY